MKRFVVFALLILSGMALAQADSKFKCLSEIISSDDEESLYNAGYNQQITTIDSVNHLILYYKGLSPAQRSAVDACKLSLTPAIARCEKIHGQGNCQPETTTFVTRKCDKGFDLQGCCQCVIQCPKDHMSSTADQRWSDNGYWCLKPQTFTVKKFNDEKSCLAGRPTQLVPVGTPCVNVRGEFWTVDCPLNYERIGDTLCTPKCPLGWNDQGIRCIKPGTYHIGHPFYWVPGDN